METASKPFHKLQAHKTIPQKWSSYVTRPLSSFVVPTFEPKIKSQNVYIMQLNGTLCIFIIVIIILNAKGLHEDLINGKRKKRVKWKQSYAF